MISQKTKDRLASTLLVILVATLLIDATQPGGSGYYFFEQEDKLLHFLVYGLIGYLGAYLMTSNNNQLTTYKAIGSMLFVAAFGLLVEYIQSTTPGRDASPADLLADILGACVFLYILKLQINHRTKPTP